MLTAVHKAVYVPRMGNHVSTRAHTIRMKTEVWDAIEAQAAELGMTRNEVVSRRLTAAFIRAREERKTAKITRFPSDDDFLELPE